MCVCVCVCVVNIAAVIPLSHVGDSSEWQWHNHIGQWIHSYWTNEENEDVWSPKWRDLHSTLSSQLFLKLLLSLSESIVCCHPVWGSKYCYVHLDFHFFHGMQPSSEFLPILHPDSLLEFLFLTDIISSNLEVAHPHHIQHELKWAQWTLTSKPQLVSLSPFLGQCKWQDRI